MSEAPVGRIHVPFFYKEDWGRWLLTDRTGFRMGLCIDSDPDAGFYAVSRHNDHPF
jgi:hypothetical protein